MKRNQIQNIFIHSVNDPQQNFLSDKINEFHLQIIANRLNKCCLSDKQKIVVVDTIISNIKSRGFV